MEFKLWLMEIMQHEMDDLLADIDFSKLKPENMPFNDMFGNKFRIVLPVSTKESREIIKSLQEKGYKVNEPNQTVSKTIKTDRGPKEQSARLTSVIQKEFGTETLLKYQKSGVFSIIVSRHPKDVMRMSDFEHMQSCHSPTMTVGGAKKQAGEWFHCVRQEIAAYGVVAYVVPKNQIQQINLEAEEIFRDDTRGVKGIIPHSRVRLRSIKNPQGKLALVPELRTYGNSSGENDMLETLRNWVSSFQNQQDAMKDANPFKTHNWDVLGGHYIDTPKNKLISKLVPIEKFKEYAREYINKKIGNWEIIDFDYDNITAKLAYYMELKTSGMQSILTETIKNYTSEGLILNENDRNKRVEITTSVSSRDKDSVLVEVKWLTKNEENSIFAIQTLVDWIAEQNKHDFIREALKVIIPGYVSPYSKLEVKNVENDVITVHAEVRYGKGNLIDEFGKDKIDSAIAKIKEDIYKSMENNQSKGYGEILSVDVQNNNYESFEFIAKIKFDYSAPGLGTVKGMIDYVEQPQKMFSNILVPPTRAKWGRNR